MNQPRRIQSARIKVTKVAAMTVSLMMAAPMVTAMIALSASAADAELELVDSSIVTSLGGVWVDDDQDRMRQRHGINDNPVMGGIEELRMEWYGEDGESTLLEGRAIFDNNDYNVRLKLNYPDKGYLSAGFKEFRTYYDNSGGFFPPSDTFLSLDGEDLHLDNGNAWFEGGLRVPGLPPLTLRYDHRFRDGKKSSTIWGDSTMTGGLGTRGFAPAFRDLDENRDTVELKMVHQLEDWAKTEIGLGATYESTKIGNSLNLARRPEEIGTDRYVTQRDDVDSDLYSIQAYTSTPFEEGRTRISTSYSYTNLDNDLGGARVYGSAYGAAYDPALPNRQPFDEGFLDLSGNTKVRRHVGSFTWMSQVSDAVRLTLRLRGEGSDVDGDSAFIETNVGFPPGLGSTAEPLSADLDSNVIRVAERLEVRHTGFDDLVLYARADFEQNDIDVTETETETATGAVDLTRETDSDLSARKYTLGAIWYPHTRFNLSSRYRYNYRENDYTHVVDSTNDNTSSNRFPAYITAENLTTQGGDLRATWRAHEDLRLTARYDISYTKISNRSEELDSINAGKIQTHMVSAGSTWTPIAPMYVQTDASYVSSRTDTKANEVTGDAGRTVTDFHNDYWTGSLIVGLAVDDNTDVEGRYFYYRTDNYSDNSLYSQPYGADSEEHGVAASVKRQWTEELATRLRYAWFKNDDGQSGGNNDYELSVVTASLEVSF